MHGPHLNEDYSVVGRPYCSDPSLYIFVVHDDKYYKMTAVSVGNAKASTKPSTPVDKYIESSNTIDVDDSATVCKMWDGDGYTTKTSTGNAYELKDVRVSGSGCGLYKYLSMYACYTLGSNTQRALIYTRSYIQSVHPIIRQMGMLDLN